MICNVWVFFFKGSLKKKSSHLSSLCITDALSLVTRTSTLYTGELRGISWLYNTVTVESDN